MLCCLGGRRESAYALDSEASARGTGGLEPSTVTLPQANQTKQHNEREHRQSTPPRKNHAVFRAIVERPAPIHKRMPLRQCWLRFTTTSCHCFFVSQSRCVAVSLCRCLAVSPPPATHHPPPATRHPALAALLPCCILGSVSLHISGCRHHGILAGRIFAGPVSRSQPVSDVELSLVWSCYKVSIRRSDRCAILLALVVCW